MSRKGKGHNTLTNLHRVSVSQDTELSLLPPSAEQVKLPLTPGSDFDFDGHTSNFVFPLHNAAKNGNLCELTALLALPGSNPFKQDFKGRTPLHYAAVFGNQKTALLMVTEILNSGVIVNAVNVDHDRSILINVQDANGETAVHLGAKTGHRKIVQLLLFSAADVNIKCKNGVEPIELIYANVPQAMCAVFDTAIRYKSEQQDPFSLLESELLAYALKNSASRCKEILVHPLVRLFLHFKWNKVRPFFWASIVIHTLWLLVFSTFLLDLYLHRCPYIRTNNTSTLDDNNDSSSNNFELESLEASLISIVMGLKELYQLFSVPTFLYYFSKLENLGQLLLIVIVALTTLPVWTYLLGSRPSVTIQPWQYQAAAFGIFLAWTLILGQIGKTPRLGLYVEILLQVLKSFGLFVLTFTSLLTAFALSFSILMPQSKSFSSWPLALSKVLIMMTGELNYDEIFYNGDDGDQPIPFRTTGHILFALFVVIVTIILFNLLIGLTVSDIQVREILLFGVICPIRKVPKELRSEVKELAMQNMIGEGGGGDCTSNAGDDPSIKAENLKVIIKDVLLQVLQEHFNRETPKS
ncbi:Transient receptor potential channel pyrexia [Folsomia candida]|uniref:Transient receptor potential channel pyrexia n=1 Tax=Folsomia candida TaxID=158441 RepID=A0A226E149_FOLCA|nr:Transient receptor potential channel pyrexia [Folsomia candida]